MKDIKWDGDKVIKKAGKLSEDAVQNGVEFILDEANKSVPHDEGTLERSGTAKSKGKQGAVGYDTKYAIRQHEVPYNHPNKGEHKWLEKTIKSKSNQKAVRDYFAKKLKGYMG